MTNRRTVLAGFFTAVALTACANPNFIGVQDYGTIIGNVVDSSGKPIVGALVSSTGSGSTYRTVGDGSFTLPQVAVGVQTLSVSAPGYGPPAMAVTVEVKKDMTVSPTPGNIVLPSVTPARYRQAS